MYPSVADGDWQATKTRIARNSSDANCGTVEPYMIGYGTSPYPFATNYDFGRALLSKQAEFLENSTTPVRERTVTYQKIQRNAAVLRGVKLKRMQTGWAYFYGVYNIMVGTGYAVSQDVVKEASEEAPSIMLQKTTDYIYNSFGLTREVRQTQTDNSITKKIIRYAKDYVFTSPVGTAAQAIKKLNETIAASAN